jgi:hypothetical protein
LVEKKKFAFINSKQKQKRRSQRKNYQLTQNGTKWSKTEKREQNFKRSEITIFVEEFGVMTSALNVPLHFIDNFTAPMLRDSMRTTF